MLYSFRKYWIFASLWLACFSVLTTSGNSLNIYAQNARVEARVTSVQGAAMISGNGKNNARLVRGAILAPGHEIDTRAGGRVVIDLTDGSQVVVMPGSRLVVGDYQNASSLRELLQITLGRVRVRINHFKNKPNPYRIKSPTASIAVRGTEFEVSVESSSETRVVVSDGTVEVASWRDLQNPLLAEPGRGVIVRADFTLDFFASVLTGAAQKRGGTKSGNGNNQGLDRIRNNSEAANVYERFVETVAGNGEIVAPSRFNAFADAHLDSLENPAYAAVFSRPEGRIYFAPSFRDGSGNENDAPNAANPIDYAVGLQGTIFAPTNRFRLVFGASGSFVASGLQSFNENSDVVFNNSPFFRGETSFRSKLDTSNNKFFDGSIIVARRFGKSERTSIGLSYERLTSNGNLGKNNQESDGNLTDYEFTLSAFRVNRKNFTVGIKHDFSGVKLGAFYRYGKNTVGQGESAGSFINFVSGSSDVDSKDSSSEIGFRLRGAFSKRFFYGTEGSLLFGRSREEFQINAVIESKQRSEINRGKINFGIGYFWRPRTIFSFDVGGGSINFDRNRRENLTGNSLETGSGQTRFLSAHAAVQTDVWSNLFASASMFSINQTLREDSAFYPNRFGRKLNAAGVVADDFRRHDNSTDFYSNYGLGWRFTPDFVFQYVLTTDYGKSAARHAFQFRYTFDFAHD